MKLSIKKILCVYSLLFNFIFLQEVFPGYALYSYGGDPNLPDDSKMTYLRDVDNSIYHSWEHATGPASMPYLHPGDENGYENTLLYYPCRVPLPTMDNGGVGGRVEIYSWEGNLLWDYELSNEIYQHHHDIAVLENGNILLISWERKYQSEWMSAGRISVENSSAQMWSTAILEIEPNLETGEATLVWEWHLWDHLVQDRSPEFTSVYGNISDYPELLDINLGSVGNLIPGSDNHADWMHVNSIDYNEDLKQIVFCSRDRDEIYIIEHSESSEIAAGHSGGIYGKGGDFLYRWGNPENYGRGNETNKIVDGPHCINWIPKGYPGEGNLMIFNNNSFHVEGTILSAVLEFSPPINSSNTYDLIGSSAYGPDTLSWVYEPEFDSQFWSHVQSSAYRLPNGNTFITLGKNGKIYEVSYEGDILWSYNNLTEQYIPRAQKYAYNYFENISGDLNNDGIINILDIVTIVYLVLESIYNEQADMNQDGLINIQDIVLLISIILE